MQIYHSCNVQGRAPPAYPFFGWDSLAVVQKKWRLEVRQKSRQHSFEENKPPYFQFEENSCFWWDGRRDQMRSEMKVWVCCFDNSKKQSVRLELESSSVSDQQSWPGLLSLSMCPQPPRRLGASPPPCLSWGGLGVGFRPWQCSLIPGGCSLLVFICCDGQAGFLKHRTAKSLWFPCRNLSHE